MKSEADDHEPDQAPSEGAAPQRTVPRVFLRIKSWLELLHDLRRTLESSRERDAEDNELGRLPEGEEVHLAGFWAAEFYLPSTVDQLIRGIEVLGWRRGRTGLRDDVVDWIRTSRSQGGGWISLGLVSSPDQPLFMSERVAELPRGVAAAFPYLYSVSSAMTALVILFVLDEGVAAGLTPILRRDYATRLEPIPPWMGGSGTVMRLVKRIGWRLARRSSMAFRHAIHSPQDLRRESVAEYAREQRRVCSEWVSKHFPGAFCSSLADRELPGAQLLITEIVDPLSKAIDEDRLAYQATGLTGSYRAWRTDEWPGMRLSLPEAFHEASRTLTIACRRADSFDPAAAHIPSQSDWYIAQYADDRIRGLAIRWASSMLLAEHQRRLSAVRDLIGAGPRKHRAVRNLKQARKLVAIEALDVEVAAAEIKRLASNGSLYRWDVLNPVEANPIARNGKSEPARLLDSLRQRQVEEADELIERLRVVMGAVASWSNIAAAISSLRLQRLVVVLTAISIAIACWAVLVAART